jgi:hypothetical protein
MERVHRQIDRPVKAASHVAVAISEVAPGRRHTGIFYRVDDTGPIEFLHLAWHCDLRLESDFSSKYCWVAPNIPKARLRQVAALCDDIVAANLPDRIPYASGPPIGAFDAHTKRFLLGPTRTGLTCASFVLAVFERAKLRLVTYSGWPSPDSIDIEFQQFVLDNLRGHPGVSTEHIDVVEREVGTSVRYRPEQVAGAAAIRGRRPVRYKHAKAIGNDIVRFLHGDLTIFEFRVSIWGRLLRWIGWF